MSSARTLGIIFYLPHLLPSALSDFSQKLTVVAPLLPSYQLCEPITFLDGEAINKLCEQNGDFAKFVEDVKIDFESKQTHKAEYDEIPKDPEQVHRRKTRNRTISLIGTGFVDRFMYPDYLAFSSRK